jgi:hypothetical protein
LPTGQVNPIPVMTILWSSGNWAALSRSIISTKPLLVDPKLLLGESLSKLEIAKYHFARRLINNVSLEAKLATQNSRQVSLFLLFLMSCRSSGQSK